MKNLQLSTVLLLGLMLFAACSNDDTAEKEASDTDILISNSPWKFERFELIEIAEKENDTTTGAWVEKIVNESYQNLTFTFKEDGTGFTTFPEDINLTWTWAFNGDSQICFEGICDDESWTTITLSNKSLSFETISFSPEDEQGNSAKNKGKYHFK